MSVRPIIAYPGKVDSPTAQYPDGKARNITTPGDGTGTPWEQAFINDLFGFLQSLTSEAGITPSGNPDEVGASDYLDSLKTILVDVTNAQTIDGVKTFGSIPIGPGLDPTADNELARKAYVDVLAPNVVQAVKSDTQTVSSTTAWTDITGLSVTITPKLATSKIRVKAVVCASESATNAPVWFRLLRDATPVGIGDAAGNRISGGFSAGNTTEVNQIVCGSQDYIDSPATASPVTYKVQLAMSAASYSAYINRSSGDTDTATYLRSVSSITVEEVYQ